MSIELNTLTEVKPRKRGRPSKRDIAEREAALKGAASNLVEVHEVETLNIKELAYSPEKVDLSNLEEITDKVSKEVLRALRSEVSVDFLLAAGILIGNLLARWKAKKAEDLWVYYNELEGSVSSKQQYATYKISSILYNIEFLGRIHESILLRLDLLSGKQVLYR